MAVTLMDANSSAPRPTTAELVVVTGMSGAGRSTAAKELEDLGYFVVDNLPPELVSDVVALVEKKLGPQQRVGVVVDVRGGTEFSSLRTQLAQNLPKRNTSLLFLDASDAVLVRRQDAARRPHPLQGEGRLLDGVEHERKVMAPLRAVADVVIDTTILNVHQLKDKVAEAFGSPEHVGVRITVVSFGFKYGVPVDADLLADMRFLPNPYWEEDLRALTGRDGAVSSYVTHRPAAQEFLERYVPVIDTICEGYLAEGKRFMTLALGCTGGKHRSVAMSEELVLRLRERGFEAAAWHRDLGKE